MDGTITPVSYPSYRQWDRTRVQGPSKGNKCSLLTGKKNGESCSQMYGSHGDGTNGTLARITLAAVPPGPYPPPRHSDQLGSFSAARCIHRGTLHLRCSRSRAVRGSALSWLHRPQLACSLISSYGQTLAPVCLQKKSHHLAGDSPPCLT